MAIIKCKMCGGDLHPEENATTCECEYCGSVQTIPTADNEKKLNLFGRAQRLLRACEFDKAAGVYESIVAEFPEEAEAYWGLVLCKYGIEYVDDPGTGKKVPTCHRSSFDSVMDDTNFEQATENADITARRVYREEAKAIEELRKGIIEVSGKEEPYDIFICYKETDENGDRTLDSVLAQDIYDALTEKGYRVFFSRITLEDKLGQEYEPYIFAALNSAKVMLAVGTDYEYYDAVWVKNEWGRFLRLIASGEKKVLIPCYKNIDAYDMPKEFARLQAQDMSKIGAMQDLMRGIEKILQPSQKQESPVLHVTAGPNRNAMLERGYLALEGEEWENAKNYFDQVLNTDAKNSEAYMGLAMAENHCSTRKLLLERVERMDVCESLNFQRAIRFSDEGTKLWYGGIQNKREVLKQKLEAKRALAIVLSNMIGMRSALYFINLDGTVTVPGLKSEGLQAFNREANINDQRDIMLFRKLQHLSNVRHIYSISDPIAKIRDLIVLFEDGTLKIMAKDMKTGYEECERWSDIVKMTGEYALRRDGTVLTCTEAVKSIVTGHRNAEALMKIRRKEIENSKRVLNWRDIADLTGAVYPTGIKRDGTVVDLHPEYQDWKMFMPRSFDGWTDICDVKTAGAWSIGLRRDGTVLSTAVKDVTPFDTSDWKRIVMIQHDGASVFGLDAYGRVVWATGEQKDEKVHGNDDCASWTEIAYISGSEGNGFFAGLRLDGTVSVMLLGSAAKENGDKPMLEVKKWRDIVAIQTVPSGIVGIQADGHIVYTSGVAKCLINPGGIEAIRDLRLFNSVETLDEERTQMIEKRRLLEEKERAEAQERIIREKAEEEARRAEAEARKARERAEAEAREKARRERQRASLTNEQAQLRNELASLKGLFTGRRRKEIEARLSQIETILQKY